MVIQRITESNHVTTQTQVIALAEKDLDLLLATEVFGVVEFLINEAKRTVVALIMPFTYTGKKGEYRNVIFRGKAKCHPEDEFVDVIGMAVSLRNALHLPIPMFYQRQWHKE